MFVVSSWFIAMYSDAIVSFEKPSMACLYIWVFGYTYYWNSVVSLPTIHIQHKACISFCKWVYLMHSSLFQFALFCSFFKLHVFAICPYLSKYCRVWCIWHKQQKNVKKLLIIWSFYIYIFLLWLYLLFAFSIFRFFLNSSTNSV